jgi:N6-adenosine-specific RNA methylase IME4
MSGKSGDLLCDVVHRSRKDHSAEELSRKIAMLFARQARPGWEAWGNEVNKFDNGYDAQDDVTKSFDAAYEAIRQRVAKAGAP